MLLLFIKRLHLVQVVCGILPALLLGVVIMFELYAGLVLTHAITPVFGLAYYYDLSLGNRMWVLAVSVLFAVPISLLLAVAAATMLYIGGIYVCVVVSQRLRGKSLALDAPTPTEEALIALAARHGYTHHEVKIGVQTRRQFPQLQGEVMQILSGKSGGFDFSVYQAGSVWLARFEDSRAQLPHIIINSKLEQSDFSLLSEQVPKAEKIKLEGDFATYFTVYAGRTNRIAALSLLTPDVMQVVLTSAAFADTELHGSQRNFLLQANDIMILESSLQRIPVLLDELAKQGRRMQDKTERTLVGRTALLARIHRLMNTSADRVGGWFLKGFGWLIILWIITFVVLSLFGDYESGPLFWLASGSLYSAIAYFMLYGISFYLYIAFFVYGFIFTALATLIRRLKIRLLRRQLLNRYHHDYA